MRLKSFFSRRFNRNAGEIFHSLPELTFKSLNQISTPFVVIMDTKPGRGCALKINLLLRGMSYILCEQNSLLVPSFNLKSCAQDKYFLPSFF